MDEQELSRAFPGGDEACLAAVIARYGHPLLRYCHHILCDYHEAQDAVQTAFIKAWDNRKRFKAGTSLQAWLYKLAYHTCIDLLRSRKRQLFAPPPPPEQPDYIGPELRAALGALTAEERGLIFGRVMDELSYDELSAIYGKSAATLRKRYERARKKLARVLTETLTEKEVSL